ncbi:MAG: ATP-binding protein [Acidimicrobiia bacterium]
MPGPEELLRLDLPADPAYVGVVRAVVTSVAGSIEGLSDDRLDDLRLAVSEACTSAVISGGVDRILVRCVHDPAALEVSIEDVGPTRASDRLAGEDFARQLLTALVDDLVIDEAEGGNVVRLRLTLDA